MSSDQERKGRRIALRRTPQVVPLESRSLLSALSPSQPAGIHPVPHEVRAGVFQGPASESPLHKSVARSADSRESRAFVIQGSAQGTTAITPQSNGTLAISLSGKGSASRLGRFSVVAHDIGESNTTTTPATLALITGDVVFTTARGGTLTFSASATGTINADGAYSATNALVVTGGTGQYAHMAGASVGNLTGNIAVGTWALTFQLYLFRSPR
jgi:hypothetical protein